MTTQYLFNSTQGVQQFTIPDGVYSMAVTMHGANGGSTSVDGYGGFGNRLTFTAPCSPGQVYEVVCGTIGRKGAYGNYDYGGAGGSPGGGAGGATGAYNGYSGAGGGGYSKLSLLYGATVAVAAGGGGDGGEANGVYTAGGDGGYPSGAAGNYQGTVTGSQGKGGTQSYGGAPGTGTTNGNYGSSLQGGTGYYADMAGGGGGGYFGGGSGATAGGDSGAGGAGGGGSSYAASNVTGLTTELYNASTGGAVSITLQIPFSAPSLTGPDNAVEVDGDAPMPFSWTNGQNGEANDTISQVEFLWSANGYSFNSIPVNGPATSYTAGALTFPSNQLIYWKVADYSNTTGQGQTSEVRTFTPVVQAALPPAQETPFDGATVDATQPLVFSWTNPPLPEEADSIQGFDLDVRETGTSAWTTTHLNGTATSYTMQPGTYSTNATYDWRVRTVTTLGPGAWSTIRTVTPVIAPSAPIITSPAAGQTVTSSPLPVEWNAPSGQQAFQVRLVADDSGAPVNGTVYSDSGATDGSDGAYQAPVSSANRADHVQVRVQANNQWSLYADVLINVDIAAPEVPDIEATPETPSGRIVVTLTNSTTGPPATSNNIYRSEAGKPEIRVATGLALNAEWVDKYPASKTKYTYRAEAIA